MRALGLILAALTVTASACSLRRPAAAPARVVILPFNNHSNEIQAAEWVREALYAEMKKRGYNAAEPGSLTEPLRNLGITDGGQLNALPLEALKEKIPGDVYCFGELKEFVFKSAVAVSQRKVTLALKLKASDGTTLFEGEETGVTTTGGLDGAGDLALNMAGKILKPLKGTKTLTDVELKSETREAVRKLLDRFPNMNLN